MPRPPTVERAVPWLLRLAWLGVAVTGAPAIDGATEGRSDLVGSLSSTAGAVAWVAGVVVLAVPAVRSLTASRLLVPIALPVAFISWIGGATATDAAAFVAAAALSTLIVYSGDLGRAFVQASAYGHEDRHLLRPPPGYLVAAIVAWLVAAAAAIAGALLLGSRHWIAGAVLVAVAVAGTVLGWPRWHRLARRWFVLVPVGLVIHDELVLAETLMLRRAEIGALRLAPVGTEALDLTGPAGGHAIEILTAESLTTVLAAAPNRREPSAVHFTACLVAPSRPGRALAAAGARRFAVG